MGGTSDMELTGLIERAQDGDRAALGELMTVVRARVLRWSRRRVTAWEERSATAEDIAQEACAAILVMLPRHRCDDGSFWPLVHGVVSHKVVDVQRRVGRDRTDPYADLPDTIDQHAADPEDGVLRGERSRRLAAVLGVLPDSYRRLLWLRVGLGWTTEEVAAEFGCTPGAVRVRQHRALTRLRRHLATLDAGPDVSAGADVVVDEAVPVG
ncbi:sigma-70 family RNA polymerase sigma factor [Actinokineospora sp. HUAS TT18]|uniref:sigma-70 family RNA polymerase sigma factor n=1 Tax=Actinokineospora sp. HUAS TT18 TaxID=3447451 RepID=UPI003F523AE9